MSVRSCSFAVIFYNPSDGCKFESIVLCEEVRSVAVDIIVVNILFGAFCRFRHSRRGYHHPVLHFAPIHHLKLKPMPWVNEDLINNCPPYTGFGFIAYIIIGNGIKNIILCDDVIAVTQAFYYRNTIPYNTGVLS